jgi:glutathione synthase
MNKYRILVLMGHKRHATEDTLYPLLIKMLEHPLCQTIDLCSRSYKPNHAFYKEEKTNKIWAVSMTKDTYSISCDDYAEKCRQVELSTDEYDVVLVRLGRPTKESFWEFLSSIYPETQIINRPRSIVETGSKEFLLKLPNLTPETRLVRNVQEVMEFLEKHKDAGIVLKPLDSSGGRGMLRIQGDLIWIMKQSIPLKDDRDTLKQSLKDQSYLAMRFLKNVSKGDNRVMVVNGEIIGSCLRKPSDGSWICNGSQGGTAWKSEADEEEKKIAKELTPILMQRGIVMFGFDTLVDDNHKRVLSEINCACCGGLVQAQKTSGAPVLERAALGIWAYITANISCKIRNM